MNGESVGGHGAARRRARTANPRALLALLALPLLLTASCSPDQQTQDAPARDITPEEEELLETAGQILLRECMESHGFEYQIVSDKSAAEFEEFRYVIDDPSWAAEHGYGSRLQREAVELRENDPNQVYFAALSPERRAQALVAANGPSPVGLTATTPDGMELGRSDQGCQSQVDRELYGDLASWFQARTTVDALPPLRYQLVVDDQRYLEAARPWADCMRAAGHDYATPADIRAALPPPQDPLPRQEEVGLALAEARCALDSGLAQAAADLDEQHGRELSERHRSALETQRRLQLDALPRARSIVAGTERTTDPEHRE
ncbi:hypothetical protein [Nocardiopsis alborubida]|uniref:hypothetical protein n=1 Tax=Nocardiopsis alborubida TaxID=146802 RepID=UPI000A934003|nr:hypothetical protein [Nocardiopsis alborubida]